MCPDYNCADCPVNYLEYITIDEALEVLEWEKTNLTEDQRIRLRELVEEAD